MDVGLILPVPGTSPGPDDGARAACSGLYDEPVLRDVVRDLPTE